MGGANQAISAGLGGFLALFVLAIVLWLLMRNMSARLRNVRFDEELEDERRAAQAGDAVLTRPTRRRIFLPVDETRIPTSASRADGNRPTESGSSTGTSESGRAEPRDPSGR